MDFEPWFDQLEFKKTCPLCLLRGTKKRQKRSHGKPFYAMEGLSTGLFLEVIVSSQSDHHPLQDVEKAIIEERISQNWL